MNRRDAIRQFSAVGAALALPVFAQTRAIVLGQSAAFSGPASALGEQFRRGALPYFDRVNARGGVAARQIELYSLDDGYEPDRCAANTKKLIDGGAFALFGYIGTPTSLVALPLATAAKLPFMAPFSGAEALRAPLPAGLGTVERNTVGVDAAVKSILAGKPDAIVQISAYKSCAAFIRAVRKASFGGTFYNVSFVGTKALAEELGTEARGVVVSQVMPYPFSPATPLAGEYLAAGKSVAGDKFEPNYSSVEGYVAAKTLVEGLKRAGSRPSVEGLIAGLESLRELNLGGFFVDFSTRRHAGSKFVDLSILTAEGKVKPRVT